MLGLTNLNVVTTNLIPVTSSEFFVGKTTNFHPDGLFSEKIFGSVDTPERRKTFSYIDLNCKVLHPALFPIIRRLDNKILVAMSGEESFSIGADGYLVPDLAGNISGMKSVIDNFDNIKIKTDSVARRDRYNMIKFYSKKDMVFIDKCLVIPAGHRDIQIMDSGEKIEPAINNYYVPIIRLADQLKSVPNGILYDHLSYRMYEYVLDLYNFLKSRIEKKGGLIRGSILGKRVDYSARAVISGVASDIRPDELGVPFKVLVKIFEPFILYDLLKSGKTDTENLAKQLEEYNGSKLSVLTVKKLLLSIYKGAEIPDSLKGFIIDATKRAIHDKVVLAKRDPTLHAESVQAFKPILTMGNTIKIHPIKCAAYNADFDGDSFYGSVKLKYKINGELKEWVGHISELETLEIS